MEEKNLIRKCEICKKDFKTNSNSQKVCSKNCQREKARKRYFKFKDKYKKVSLEYMKKYNQREYVRLRHKILALSRSLLVKEFLKLQPCSICKKRKCEEIHHKKYRYPPQFKDLLLVCRRCHRNEFHSAKSNL